MFIIWTFTEKVCRPLFFLLLFSLGPASQNALLPLCSCGNEDLRFLNFTPVDMESELKCFHLKPLARVVQCPRRLRGFQARLSSRCSRRVNTLMDKMIKGDMKRWPEARQPMTGEGSEGWNAKGVRLENSRVGKGHRLSWTHSTRLVLPHRGNDQQQQNDPCLRYPSRIRVMYLWSTPPTLPRPYTHLPTHRGNPPPPTYEHEYRPSVLLKVLIQTQAHLWFTECETVTPTKRQTESKNRLVYFSLCGLFCVAIRRES